LSSRANLSSFFRDVLLNFEFEIKTALCVSAKYPMICPSSESITIYVIDNFLRAKSIALFFMKFSIAGLILHENDDKSSVIFASPLFLSSSRIFIA